MSSDYPDHMALIGKADILHDGREKDRWVLQRDRRLPICNRRA